MKPNFNNISNSKAAEDNAAANSAQVLFKEAMELHKSGQFARAQAVYEQLLKIQPVHFDALHMLGVIAEQMKNSAKAVALITRAIEINPDNAAAFNNLGAAFRTLKQYPKSIASYDKAIALKPDYPEAYNNRGNALRDLKQYAAAISSYDKAIALKPGYAEAYSNRSMTLNEIKQHDAAIEDCNKAIALKPGYAEAYFNRGNVFYDLNKFARAIESYDKAIAFKPEYAEAYGNRGAALRELKQHVASLANYNKAIELKPDYADGHWNQSLCYLQMGDFKHGWEKYEWRWKNEQITTFKEKRNFPQPLWLGVESLQGKTILLHSEQGFGDTIQFCRYAKLVSNLGARVILELQKPLLGLLANLEGVAELVGKNDKLPPFDYHCPLLSLPLAFKTDMGSIPVPGNYLAANPGKIKEWSVKLGPKTRPRVGLVWSGSTTHKNDSNRSISLSDLVEHLPSGFQYVCLQKEIREADRKTLEAHPEILQYSGDLKDFTETAALCELVDVVVSVDTVVVHLAGALGKPVWVLLPFNPDWRWLLDRDDSPWYPSAKLYRQASIGDWEGVFKRVEADLQKSFMGELKSKHSQAPAKINFVEQRIQAVLKKETDYSRWMNPDNLCSSWEQRSRFAATLIPKGSRVLDLGCGKMTVEKYLDASCTYLPADLVPRDIRTLHCDINKGEIPVEINTVDIVMMLGVIEYVFDLPSFLKTIERSKKKIVVSYCDTDSSSVRGFPERKSLGWVNNYSKNQIRDLFAQAKLTVASEYQVDNLQTIYILIPADAVPEAKKVAVLSYSNVGNFGDRLGVHVLSSIMPSNAVVKHIHFKPWIESDENFDLLILGIGNSIFAPLLNEKVFNLVNRSKMTIGIFGTQYRNEYPRERMRELISSLDYWYARYEDDLSLYATNDTVCTHLGDWLIKEFNFVNATNSDKVMKIGREIWKDLPIDRTIQQIQMYKKVFSERLHPLLCALTSAEEVAYIEQRESGKGNVSGKFNSMLIDVFGTTYPENVFWKVNRLAVMNYRQKVVSSVRNLENLLYKIL